MVMAHGPDGSLAAGPYDEPADVQANPDDYQTPYDSIAQILADQSRYLERIADAAEAQRETPRQTMIKLSTVPFSTTLRYRITEIVLTSTGASEFGLIVGSATQQTFVFSVGDTKRLPYITVIDRGVDISLSATGGIIPTGYLVGYPE